MRILYITPSFHHPKLRGPSRHYYFIRELSRRHRITLLSFTRTAVPPEILAEMRGYVEEALVFDASATHREAWTALKEVPLLGRRLTRLVQRGRALSDMRAAFHELTRERPFDLVLFHGKPVFQVIDGWNDLPIVADFCDATSLRYATRMREAPWTMLPLLALKYLAVRRVERRLLKKTPHVAFVSSRDRRAVLGQGSDATVIPLGVDLEYWQRSSTTPRQRCLIFTGVFDYSPNADAAARLVERILPRVRAVVPDVELIIAGRNPSATLTRRAATERGVTVTGFVDDLRPYMEQATVYVAPIQVASGTQTKILEALAMQVPVVTTPEVCDGLRLDEGVEPPLLQGTSDADIAGHIVRLLQHEDERRQLMANGRRYAEQYFSWQRGAQMLEEMCHVAVGRADPGTLAPRHVGGARPRRARAAG